MDLNDSLDSLLSKARERALMETRSSNALQKYVRASKNLEWRQYCFCETNCMFSYLVLLLVEVMSLLVVQVFL